MSRPSILIVGGGGHARACVDVIEQDGRYAIAGVVIAPAETGAPLLGYPVAGSDDDLPALVAEHHHGIVTVGQIKSPQTRIRLFERLLELGCDLPVVVSPRAYVSPRASLGAGTIVMHGAVVNAGAVVGRNCIINSQALVEHDAIVGDHCHISTMAAVNGGVRVGDGSFIGSGSSVRESITIGARCVIGLRQSVVVDCPAGTQMPPARARNTP